MKTFVPVLAILSILLPAQAYAEAVDGSRIHIVDGDTIGLPCAVPGPKCSERIRFEGIDAPESFKPTCENEQVYGLKAKARLVELLRTNPVTVSRVGTDRYGRTLANVSIPAGDVGKILMSEGLALPYAPGRAAKASRIAHWCGPGNW